MFTLWLTKHTNSFNSLNPHSWKAQLPLWWSDCSEQNWCKVCNVVEESFLWIFLSDFCQDGLDCVISDRAGEDGLFSIAVRVLKTRSKGVFVTLVESLLRLWEDMFKRARGGNSQKPRKTCGTPITTSCLEVWRFVLLLFKAGAVLDQGHI